MACCNAIESLVGGVGHHRLPTQDALFVRYTCCSSLHGMIQFRQCVSVLDISGRARAASRVCPRGTVVAAPAHPFCALSGRLSSAACRFPVTSSRSRALVYALEFSKHRFGTSRRPSRFWCARTLAGLVELIDGRALGERVRAESRGLPALSYTPPGSCPYYFGQLAVVRKRIFDSTYAPSVRRMAS